MCNNAFIRVKAKILPVMENTGISTGGFYHICSDGNSSAVLFRNESDFKAAMNRLAICTLHRPVEIYAFVLMGNHFHIVGRFASEDDGFAYAIEFKRLTGKYITDVYQEKASLCRLPVKVLPIHDADYLRTVIAYVVKNPTKARMEMFYDYPWGSGSLYFSSRCKVPDLGTVKLADLGAKPRRQLCRSRRDLPDGWLFKDGIILPQNYVAAAAVEQLYRTTKSYMYYLSMNKDEEIERDYGDWNALQLPDAELRIARMVLSREMFGTDNIRDLSAPDRLRLARRLQRKYLCSKKQIARIVMLPYEYLMKAL